MKKILNVIGIVAVCMGLTYATYSGFTAKPKNSMLTKNIEALSQSSREMLDEVDIIARAYQVQYTIVNHGSVFSFEAKADIVCPMIGVGGAIECPHKDITIKFDCCNFTQHLTNGCSVYPLSCSTVLKQYGLAK